jgi:hypothetical protein
VDLVEAMAAVVLVVHVLGGHREEGSDDERDQRHSPSICHETLIDSASQLVRVTGGGLMRDPKHRWAVWLRPRRESTSDIA